MNESRIAANDTKQVHDPKPEPSAGDKALYEETKPSVANIVASHFYNGKQVMGSAGSGFFVKSSSDQGLPSCELVTDNHVISIDPRLTVQFEVELDDGSKHKASLIGQDPKHDLAFLKVEDVADAAKTCKPLTLSDKPAQVGDFEMRVSRSHLDGPEFYTGKLQKEAQRKDLDLPELSGDDMERKVFEFDNYNTIGHQFSGGVYVNKDGEVIAIHEAGQGSDVSIGTPASDIKAALDQIHQSN